MPVQGITTKIISTLGNKESLIPIMIKDGVDSTCLTVKSFKEGGIVEGIDRGTDEFGTQAIWIGGIPLYKKIIDSTLYKGAKLNPGVDPRVIGNKEYAQWALENAAGIMPNDKTQSVKQAITDCLKDGGKKAQNLYKTKVAAATALTLGTFFLVTKLKQKNTKNNVIKKLNNQVKDNEFTGFQCDSKIFSDINNENSKSPSFKGMAKNFTDAVMFNPVHNMKIIDAGITTERLACSRNKTEFCEHAIKEGGFLFFIYGFGNLIEKGINKISEKILNKPIDLPIDVLMDDKFAQSLKNGKIAQDTAMLPKNTPLKDKLDFLINNPDNILVQAAKKSKIVSTCKDKSGNLAVDTSKYIDTEAVEKLAENLKVYEDKFIKSGETAKTFLNKTKGLKVMSVAANIGVSCLFLGFIIPKAIYKYRENKTGTTKFHVEEDIKNTAQKHNV